VVIPLNLVWTYPASWSRYKVLCDFVQNFYDAVGADSFHARFRRRREGDLLVFEVDDVGFSYDWLLHFGASTKTHAKRGQFAGFFGEGFKVAALCAWRDHGWRVRMASRDWTLDVTQTESLIDGQKVTCLAYRVRSRPYAEVTTLWLSPFSAEHERDLEAAVLSFYYPENQILGECIHADETIAVHLRSKHPIPREWFPHLPPSRTPGPGIVFVGRQASGEFEIPLVVADHSAIPPNRDRDAQRRLVVVLVNSVVAVRLPARAAAVVLEQMRRKWHEPRPRPAYEFYSFHGVLAKLIERVATDETVKRRWRAEHPDLLALLPVDRRDREAASRRHEALVWLRSRSPRPPLVHEEFVLLGHETLEQACERAGGFICLREPHAGELAYLAVLQDVVRATFPELVPEGGLPPVRVIERAFEKLHGQAGTRLLSGRRRRGGMRYWQSYVALSSSLLTPGRFGQAMATFLHELSHVYGGDRSAAFSSVLTDVLGWTVEEAESLVRAGERWQALGAAGGVQPRAAAPAASADGPSWAELLERDPQAFFALLFPAIYPEVDWRRPAELLEEEVRQTVRPGEQATGATDKLLRLWRRSGEEVWVLLHVETRARGLPAFEQLMDRWSFRCFDRYGRHPVCLALLADDDPTWRPERHSRELGGCRAEIRFPTVKAMDLGERPGEMASFDSPVARILRARLGPRAST
jgi:hypothetical protein